MSYRNYNIDNKISQTYKLMYTNQTLEYVKDKHELFKGGSNEYNTEYLIEKMDNIIDESDPDADFPQSVHAYQTGESIFNNYLSGNKLKKLNIREIFSCEEWNNLEPNVKLYYEEKNSFENLYKNIKQWDWLALVGFIHDLGKMLLLPEFGNLPQWSVVGDIFPVGCEFSSSNIYFDEKYHEKSSDFNKFDELGIYKEGCGLEELYMSFSHDYYLYNILKKNKVLIPDEGLYLIRFHSFYSWHTPKNGNQGYSYFANNKDWYMLPLLKLFQKSDLYSKTNEKDNYNFEKYYNLLKKYKCNCLLI